ncbi:MAG TPA: DUF6491 family protein [Phenylobacterium sp.]|nr:DUF6491 family protein [Phenylobacterium sp.]
MSKSILGAAGAVAALLVLAGGAATAAEDARPKPPRSCFLTRNVNSWSAADDKTVYVRVGVKDIYRLDLLGPCPDIDWNWSIALESHGSSWICSPLDATIIAKSPIGPQRCPVRQVTRLTPQEIAALPPRHKP